MNSDEIEREGAETRRKQGEIWRDCVNPRKSGRRETRRSALGKKKEFPRITE
jgi:hypothetical protein